MSLPHNQSQTPQSHITPDPLQSARRSTEFEMQAALILDENKFEYLSPADMIRIIRTTAHSGSADEYFLYFHGVTHGHLRQIYREFSMSKLGCTVRFTTENSLGALICRILPGWRHLLLTYTLSMKIEFKVSAIPGHTCDSIDSFGGMRFDIRNIRSKEGHMAFVPATRCKRDAWPSNDAWPSMMLEVGYSEALDFLRLDAKWWLINSAGKTRFVMIVQLMTNPFAIHIECWAMVSSDDQQTIKAPTLIPTCVQLFDIGTEGTVTSASPELCIPYSYIFDEPNENAVDVVFTNAELSSFALLMFSLLSQDF